MSTDPDRLRPSTYLLAVAAFLCATWWAWMAGTSEQPEPSRDTTPAPWVPATAEGPAVTTEVGP